MDRWIRANFAVLFESELEGWYTDSDLWRPIWEISDLHAFIFEGSVLEGIRLAPRTEA